MQSKVYVARGIEASGAVGEDRAAALEYRGALVLVVADGAGGMSGGEQAAEEVVRQTETLLGQIGDMRDPMRWRLLVTELDQRLYQDGRCGEAAIAVAAILDDVVIGASAGDASVWLMQPGQCLDLTEHQVRRPMPGSGRARPTAFGPLPFQGTLMVSSDGITRYVPRLDIVREVAQDSLDAAARGLINMARLPSGVLQDDAAVLLARSGAVPVVRHEPVLDRSMMSWIAHHEHNLCSPLSQERMAQVMARMGLGTGALVLDVGAGKGHALLHLALSYGAQGVALELSPRFAQEARRRADECCAPGQISVINQDARAWLAEHPEARFHAVICMGSTHALGGLDGALHVLTRHLLPGGCMLLGEGFWRHEPEPDYLAFLGAKRQDMRDHAGNVEAIEAAGLIPMWAITASDEEWDEYEWMYSSNVEVWAAQHPADPQCALFLDRIRAWRRAYLRWGRHTLGFGTYLMVKPA